MGNTLPPWQQCLPWNWLDVPWQNFATKNECNNYTIHLLLANDRHHKHLQVVDKTWTKSSKERSIFFAWNWMLQFGGWMEEVVHLVACYLISESSINPCNFATCCSTDWCNALNKIWRKGGRHYCVRGHQNAEFENWVELENVFYHIMGFYCLERWHNWNNLSWIEHDLALDSLYYQFLFTKNSTQIHSLTVKFTLPVGRPITCFSINIMSE